MRTLIALSLATVVAAANVVGCSDTGTKVSPSPMRDRETDFLPK